MTDAKAVASNDIVETLQNLLMDANANSYLVQETTSSIHPMV